MAIETREKWDRIYRQSQAAEPSPAEVLSQYAHYLPQAGRALDLACGLGGNALFLARLGFSVTAWDISPVAVAALSLRAQGLNLTAQARDVEAEPFPLAAFDVVVVSRFLCRSLARPIEDSLKPGGLLFYQTYLRNRANPHGPGNPDYLLEDGELLRLFDRLSPLAHREDGQGQGIFVGQKPTRQASA